MKNQSLIGHKITKINRKMLDLILGNCMDYLPKFKDNEFDLAIVDPPYGIGGALHSNRKLKGAGKLKNIALNKFSTEWDNNPPQKEYFTELKRVSKNQIIWGGNYFGDYLGRTRGVICWDKMQYFPNFSAWEMAWTSFDVVARLFKYDCKYPGKIHPTQKPVQLYRWLLQNYAKEGDTILDTHGGSMSIAIACHMEGFDLTLFEIDKDYYEAGLKRLKTHQSQPELF